MRAPVFKIKQAKNQSGLVSIVVVSVLVILLALVSIGFARLMDRTLTNSVNNQQSLAAEYAARSALNDVITYLKTNPGISSNNCTQLMAVGQPFYNKNNLSGDNRTAYKCILINPQPGDLAYQAISPNTSQDIKLSMPPAPAPPVDKLSFSWQSNDGQTNYTACSTSFLDETTWDTNNCAPPLRVTIYPVPVGGAITNAQTKSKTFFLYPNGSGTSTAWSTADGSLKTTTCVAAADYDCNMDITGLSTAISPSTLGYLLVRVTPLYDKADLKIKAYDISNNPVVTGGQSQVDVTAQSGSTLKRLQARVEVGGSVAAATSTAPDYSLRSAKTVCKRYQVLAALVIVDTTPHAVPPSPECFNFPPVACDPCDTGCNPPGCNPTPPPPPPCDPAVDPACAPPPPSPGFSVKLTGINGPFYQYPECFRPNDPGWQWNYTWMCANTPTTTSYNGYIYGTTYAPGLCPDVTHAWTICPGAGWSATGGTAPVTCELDSNGKAIKTDGPSYTYSTTIGWTATPTTLFVWCWDSGNPQQYASDYWDGSFR